MGESGLEMGEDLCCCGPTIGFSRQLGRWAASEQSRADGALASVESFPDALEGSVAPRAVDGVDGGGDGADDGVLEKCPQGPGGEAQPPDFVGNPDAEGPSAAATAMAITTEDPPGPDRLSWWAGLVKSAEDAVADERADDLAVGAGDLFEPLDDSNPVFITAVEPGLVAHVVGCLR